MMKRRTLLRLFLLVSVGEPMRLYATPFDQIDPRNPLFLYGARRFRWANRIRRASLRWAGLAGGIVLALWLLAILGAAGSSAVYGASPSRYNSAAYGVMSASSSFWGIAFVVSIGADVLLDMVCLAATVNAISGEITGGRWDLLRLSSLRSFEIIDAQHGLGQLRAWRFMAVIVGARVAVVLIAGLQAFALPMLLYNDTSVSGLFGYFGLIGWLVILTFGVFFLVYIVEPFWRMRAMTALGLAISARVASLTSGLLAGFGAIVGVWVVQAIIMGVVLGVCVFVLSLFFVLCGPFICAGVGFIIYQFYQTLTNQTLVRAGRRLAWSE
jgi:hypothetical protein